MSGNIDFSISVVMPCYQEVHRLDAAVEGFSRLSSLISGRLELVLVENGSTDGTGARADEIASARSDVRVIHLEEAGKGAAIKAGILSSQADWYILADADWSMSPEEVPRLLPGNTTETVRIASREHADSVRLNEPWYRHVLGRCFNLWIRATILPGFHDTQCGFKGLEGALAREVAPHMRATGWAFDVELLALARKSGHTVTEVPLTWRHDPDSRIRPVFHGFTMGLAVLGLYRRFGTIQVERQERDREPE